MFQPLAVKTEAIDHRLIFIQPEQARLGVARLRQRCDATGFNKAKAEREHGVHHLGVFVEARSQTNRIRER